MGLGGVQLGGAEIEEDGRRQDGMDGLGRGMVGGSGSRNFARGSGIEGGDPEGSDQAAAACGMGGWDS